MAITSSQTIVQPFDDDLIRTIGESHDLDTFRACDDPNVAGDTTQDAQPVMIADMPTRSKFKTAAIVIALYMTLAITALSATVVATAAPTMSTQLGSQSGYAWIGGAYILATGAAAPIFINLSDIWGRKPILLIASGIFFVASILCATAKDMKRLIAGRTIQGIAGGDVGQLVNVTIADLFSIRERTLYYGYMQIIWALASAIGPVLGGLFAQTIGWRYCFWINLPVSGLAFILVSIFLDVHNPRTRIVEGLKAIDWAGSVTMLSFVVMVLLGLDLGGTTFPWNSPRIITLIVCGCLMAVLFVLCERRLARYPLLPLELFQYRATNACIIIGFVQDFVLMGAEYYMPLFFQVIYQVSPLKSGLLTLPLALTGSLVAVATGIMIHRTGRYIEIIRVGLAVMTLGFGLFIDLSPTISLALIICFEIIGGIGNGCLFQPPMVAMQAAVSTESQSTATSSLGFARNMAAGLSVVMGGTVFQSGMHARASQLRAAGIAENIILALTTGAGAGANIQLVKKVTDVAQRTVLLDTLSASLRNVWIMYTVASACGLCASALLSHRVLSEEHVEVKTGLKRE